MQTGRKSALSVIGGQDSAALLKLALEWSNRRIGAVIGGCVLLSPRRLPVEVAIGGRDRDGTAVVPLADRLQRQVFTEATISAVLRCAEASRLSIVSPSAGDAYPLGRRSRQALEQVRLTQPLLAVLRANGRIGAVLWLSRLVNHPTEEREADGALRSVQPLLELVLAGTLDAATSPRPDDSPARMTPREDSVARFALAGLSNAAIAAKLGIAESTVKKHMNRVLVKHGVRGRSQLISLLGARWTAGLEPSGEAT